LPDLEKKIYQYFGRHNLYSSIKNNKTSQRRDIDEIMLGIGVGGDRGIYCSCKACFAFSEQAPCSPTCRREVKLLYRRLEE